MKKFEELKKTFDNDNKSTCDIECFLPVRLTMNRIETIIEYVCSEYNLNNFLEYDNHFNEDAGIYEIDKSLKVLKKKLKQVMENIANDREVSCTF